MKNLLYIATGLLLICAASISQAREQGATIFFRSKTAHEYDLLLSRVDKIKIQFLEDKRFVDYSTLDPFADKRPKMLGWRFDGIKDKEFGGTSVIFEAGGHLAWIKILCSAHEIESEKIEKLKALISSIIGDSEMSEIEIKLVYENMFDTRP